MSAKPIDTRPLVTVALVTSGTVLAVTGVSMLLSGWGAVGVMKAWKLIGVSEQAIATTHRWAALGFLGASGIHVGQRRKVLARHLRLQGVRRETGAPGRPRGEAPARAAA